MQKQDLQIHNFSWSDLDALAELLFASSEDSSLDKKFAVEQLERSYRKPGLVPERDCFLAWSGSKLAGYYFLIEEKAISRGILEGTVHPEFRNHGIGKELIKNALAQARSMHYEVLHANISSNEQAIRKLLLSNGFKQVKELLHMHQDYAKSMAVEPSTNYRIRTMNSIEVEKLTILQNAAFVDSWGFCPNSVEQVTYSLNDLFPGLINTSVFLEFKEVPVAYIWVRQTSTKRHGCIDMVGVHPEFRGKGLAKIITASGINYLCANGMPSISISVLDDNTPAVRTYEGLGFEVRERNPWYELDLSRSN